MAGTNGRTGQRFRRLRHRRRGERASALVEFALVTPLLMLLLAGLVELGDAANAYISVVNASRDGARLGSRGSASNSEVQALVLTNLGRLRDSTSAADVTVTRNVVSGQDSVRVRVCHNHRTVVKYPLLPLPDPMRMCAETTMRTLILQ